MSSDVRLWDYRRIPYIFEEDFPYKKDVEAAMRKWESVGGIKFVERRNEKNYIIVKQPPVGDGSSSWVGMRCGAQDVLINAGYKSLHELGHAIGLIHEQTRSDRDDYITVQWDHVSNGQRNGNFAKDTNSCNLTSYDSESVMHYPAPAKGWSGYPSDESVWTMRWNSNPDWELGAGPHQGWDKLSDQDQSSALRTKYETVPVPMGRETANGSWHNPYAVQFPFTVGGKHYVYGQNLNGKNWFIQELMDDGTMGEETDQGRWRFAYAVQFAFEIDGRVFFYGQNMDERNWFIQELLAGGKMGGETDNGSWQFSYQVQFPFEVDGKVYFYGQNLKEKNWFVQELRAGGTIGEETANGTWSFAYAVQFPFVIDGRVFFYGQNMREKNWFVQELLAGGKMGSETDNGTWNNAYKVQFGYNINGRQYFCGQNLDTRYWFIQRIEPGGKMGEEVQGGSWTYGYGCQYPFKTNAGQFYFGQKLESGYNWFIQELIDVIPNPACDVGA